MADHAQLEKAATEIEAQFGPIDVWINVAFTSVFAPFAEIAPDEFRRVTEVSYLGYVNGTMVALSRMRPRNAGTIVQVGSALSERAIPLQSAYCGAKHAINGFTESLRCELLHEHSGVRVTVVQMPAVNTPQFSWVLSRLPRHPQPVPPIYQPEVAAHGVVYAADHPGRKQYWVGGSTAATLLAQKVAPAILDRYLARTGFDAQQTDQAVPVGSRPDNLFDPADGAAGARLRRARHLRRPVALAELAAAMRRIIRRWPVVSRPGPRWPARCWFADWRAVLDAGAARPDGWPAWLLRNARPAGHTGHASPLRTPARGVTGWPGTLARPVQRDPGTATSRPGSHTATAGGSMSKGNSTGAWAVTLARAGYGVALVCAPQALIKLTGDPVTGQPAGASRARPSRRACGVARVLGVRHLVQAGLTAAALRGRARQPGPAGAGRCR